jgi:UDP-N-acetylmuramate--alanine ligase
MLKKINKNKTIYFVGIKGVGMTMLAQFLKKQGYQILGSDLGDVFLSDKVLKSSRIKVLSPFSVKNIPSNLGMIVYSSAYNKKNNLEIKFIAEHPEKFKNISVLSYAEVLGNFFNSYKGLAVCGTHGKTTNSAWLAYVLWKSGIKINALVGSRVPQFAGSSLAGKSSYLVAEVDEYQNKLQYFQPQAVVLNNIDYDHPDFFKTPASYLKVFADFLKKIPREGFLVFNNRDSNIKKIKQYCQGQLISYDLMAGSDNPRTKEQKELDYLAFDLKIKNTYQVFKLDFQGNYLGEFKIKLWGKHNVLNALAVIAAARKLRVPMEKIKKYLASFTGTERRTQVLGKYKGALIIDDYAHHPTEIKATLQGLAQHYAEKNLITIFHPHTFTRTKALFADFVKSFSETNELIVLDIYGSAREKKGGVSSQELVLAIKKFNKKNKYQQKVKYISTIAQTVDYLRPRLKKTDLLLLMGAGDVFRVAHGLLKKNKKKI